MRKLRLLVFTGLCGLLTLSACQTAEGREEALQPSQQTQTPVSIVGEVGPQPLPEPTLESISAMPTPQETPDVSFDVDDEACGDTFCLVTWPGWLDRPIGQGDNRLIDQTYPYGSTGEGLHERHHGVEFINAFGTPVFAAQAGDVVFAGMDDETLLGPYRWFYGNVVVLRHPHLVSEAWDIYTLYAHLSEITVAIGDRVTAGEKIGEVGASGAADGPHLHFETRVGLNDYAHTVNPVLWFAPFEDADHSEMAALAGLVVDRYGNPRSELPLTLEKLGAAGEVEAYYYPFTYPSNGVNAHPIVGENFAITDIAAGNYRLSLISGRLYEFTFSLEPGTLGFIKVQLD
jgi:murein DD-endopeptidase MepM/ murein hydrolase activator NlpD